MSARRIARELAVIVLPQLPKDKGKLEKLEFDYLIARSVQMLADHAKQCLADANSILIRSRESMTEIEVDHPDNKYEIENMKAVPLTTEQMRAQLVHLETAMQLISEALDIPEMTLASNLVTTQVECPHCHRTSQSMLRRPHAEETRHFLIRLVEEYCDHRQEIDEFLTKLKTKWRFERMVSIDRDILRLALAEAFYMKDIPINVAISEAVELGHRFADERAAKFINGILSEVAGFARQFRATGVVPDPLKETDSEVTGETRVH